MTRAGMAERLLAEWIEDWADPPADDEYVLCGECHANPHEDDCLLVRTRSFLQENERAAASPDPEGPSDPE